MAIANKLTISDISNSFNIFSTEELLMLNKHLVQIVKNRNVVKRMEATIAFNIGDKVEFTNPRDNKIRKCAVEKVKRVNILCRELPGSAMPGYRWNIPASLLRKS